MRIAVRLVAAAGLLVVGWALATSWGGIVHGNPAYLALLLVTVVGCLLLTWWSWRLRTPVRGGRLVGSIVLLVLACAWLAGVAWLRPFSAVEPALAAMESDSAVTVEETATVITLVPAEPSGRGLLYQPGAKVEARAYAAVLRPLAEAGITVVIPKQPLGIAFLSMGALDAAREAHPDVQAWVVGGHSLGGTVSAMTAEEQDDETVAPVTGLLLHASYPASDMSTTLTAEVLSVSGTADGLATPADIEASAADLPPTTVFLPLEGVVHAFFGDYGPQPGDGEPGVSHDEARAEISDASRAFVLDVPCSDCGPGATVRP